VVREKIEFAAIAALIVLPALVWLAGKLSN
jgi:hypothetical protein